MTIVALLSASVFASACTRLELDASGTAERSEDDTAGDSRDDTAAGAQDGSDPVPAEPQAPIERDLDSFPELELDPRGPGSDGAYDALIADLEAFVDADAAPPWPDLRDPDPAVAYRSSSQFQNWMMENDPDPALVSGYAAPDGPEWGWDRDMFSQLQSNGWFAGPASPPYSLSVLDVVHPGASPISDALLAEVPPGSAAVVYYDSVGASFFVDRDGNPVEEKESWSNVGPWVAIMEPTDVGWRVWWDELVYPPPGDEWERGPQARIEEYNRA